MIDIAKLAAQAEIDIDEDFDIFGSTNGSLARFTALVLEAAAVECDNLNSDQGLVMDEAVTWCADAIRAMKPAKEQT